MADLITSYAFLGTLMNSGSDIFNFVYVPLCKRCLSEFVTSTKTDNKRVKGKASDIAIYILKDYYIDVPVIVVRKLLLAVNKQLSHRDKLNFDFVISKDGDSFECDNYVFNDLEEEYKKQERNSNKLQSEFERYVKDQSVSDTDIAPFADFIKKYQIKLKGFFSSSHKKFSEDEIETSYLLHAHFLQYIEKNDDSLYKICLKIYIGAIIATFLETQVELSRKQKSRIVYYIDTSLILSALDLQTIEATKPAIDLFRLIKKTGGISYMLDVTQSEIKSILDRTRNVWSDKNPKSKVNEACIRTKKKLSHITEFASDIPQYVLKNIGVNYQQIEIRYKDDFRTNSDVEKLKALRWKKGTALPDVIAYLYVRHNRGNNCDAVSKANYWFVTGNAELALFNKQNALPGCVQEVITIDALTCMLFVQNPRDYEQDVSIIGLHSLIAQTIAEETIDKELLEEFRERLEEIDTVSEDKYDNLIATVSEESPKKLRRLIEDSDNKQFGDYINDVIKHRDEREKKRLQKEETVKKERDTFSQQLKDSKERENEIERQLQENKEIIKEQSTKIDEQNKENEKLKRRNTVLNELVAFIACLFVCFLLCLIPAIKNVISYTYDNDGLLGIVFLSIVLIFVLAYVTIGNINSFCKSNRWIYIFIIGFFIAGLCLTPSLNNSYKAVFAAINVIPWACASFLLNLLKTNK